MEILPQSLGSEEWVWAAIEEWVALGFLNACLPGNPIPKAGKEGFDVDGFFFLLGLPAGAEEWVSNSKAFWI